MTRRALPTPFCILQSAGGEQGDPLMPGLFAVGIHQALRAVHPSLQPGEDLFDFVCISG